MAVYKCEICGMSIGSMTCGECGKESEVPANRLVCEHCGDWRTQLLSGDELMLERVVLDTAGRGD